MKIRNYNNPTINKRANMVLSFDWIKDNYTIVEMGFINIRLKS